MMRYIIIYVFHRYNFITDDNPIGLKQLGATYSF